MSTPIRTLPYPFLEKDKTPLIDNLEKAAFIQIQRTLANVTAEEVDGLSPHLQKLYLLTEGQHGILPFQTKNWLTGDDAKNDDFLDTMVRNDGVGRFVCIVGQSLASIFRGEVEPLSVMLQDNMLSTYYRRHDLTNLGYEIGTFMIGKLAFQIPSMNMIELGTGTGGATMPTLKTLGKRFAHYDFTDISTGFFESAKEKQKEWTDRISKHFLRTVQLVFVNSTSLSHLKTSITARFTSF